MEICKGEVFYDAPNDMSLVTFGSEDCVPGHSFGPAIRDYHLFHLVTKGQGKFTINKQTYFLKEGEMFYIPPELVTVYRADFSNPWSYVWVGMRGIMLPAYIKTTGLSEKNPVVAYSDELLSVARKIVSATETVSQKSPFVTGQLFLFFDELINCCGQAGEYKSNSQIYVENSVNYIHNNLNKKISISEISKHIGIDRSYLCAIFKKLLGCSPQAYILNTKIEMAKKLLTTTNDEIRSIGESLGYSDQLTFTHFFKTKTGQSPREWRCSHKGDIG